MTLAGKVALVTGGSSGIGRATVLALAAQGAKVAVNYRQSAAAAEAVVEAVRAQGGEALAIGADVAADKDRQDLVRSVENSWGKLDFLVNNAGSTVFLPAGDLDALSEEIWDRTMDVNVRGAFFLSRAAAPLLRASRGAIVNVSSTASLNAIGSSIAYSASKAALNNLTLSLARALAPEVRVNAVAPGLVDTPWLERGLGERLPSVRKWVLSQTPLGNIVQPEEVAQAILSLLTLPQVTGQVLVVDGGFTLRG